MVVVSVSVLLARSGSVTDEEAVAVLTSVPAAGASPVTVMTEVPGGKGASRVQVTIPASGAPQFHPVPRARAAVRPAGSVSVTLADIAMLGPWLVTVSVYVRNPPGSTGSGASVIVSSMSAFAETEVWTVTLLLERSGSVAVGPAETVDWTNPCAGALPVTLIVADSPTARGLSPQSTTL